MMRFEDLQDRFGRCQSVDERLSILGEMRRVIWPESGEEPLVGNEVFERLRNGYDLVQAQYYILRLQELVELGSLGEQGLAEVNAAYQFFYGVNGRAAPVHRFGQPILDEFNRYYGEVYALLQSDVVQVAPAVAAVPLAPQPPPAPPPPPVPPPLPDGAVPVLPAANVGERHDALLAALEKQRRELRQVVVDEGTSKPSNPRDAMLADIRQGVHLRHVTDENRARKGNDESDGRGAPTNEMQNLFEGMRNRRKQMLGYGPGAGLGSGSDSDSDSKESDTDASRPPSPSSP